MRRWIVGLSIIAVAGCATSNAPRDYESSRSEITRLETRIARAPADRDARVELGRLLVAVNRPIRAEPHLRAVLDRDTNDAEARLFLGLALEGQARFQEAVETYTPYRDLPNGEYRQLIGARYEWAYRRVVADEMRARLRGEDELVARPDAIAVLSYTYRGSDPDYEVLSRGMAELMSNDLANVSSLTVVERVRLQALLDELALSESGLVDAATAPRAGKLLGAGRILSGAFDVRGEELDLESALMNVNSVLRPVLQRQSGDLASLFRMQKRMVFDLLDRMGIELTPEERARIEFIPTENLQAFLLYSRGLRARDQGRFQQAVSLFEEARDLDAGFSEAGDASTAADVTDAVVGQATDDVIADLTGAGVTDVTISLIDDRIVQLLQNIDANVLPGDDDRDAPEETGTAAPPILRLPPPPPPPAGGNQP